MTIKQLADELGLSKVSVNKKIDELGLKDQLIKEGNRFIVPVDVADSVREAFGNRTEEKQNRRKNDQSADVIAVLSNQLDEKDKQIQGLMSQIEALTDQLKTVQDQNTNLLQTVQQGNYLLAGAMDSANDHEHLHAETVTDAETVKERQGFFRRFFK